MAQVEAEGFSKHAVEAAQKAAELDPKLYEAHEQLAYLALEDNDEERAAKEADKALAISARSAGRHGDSSPPSIVCTTRTNRPGSDRILKINPAYGEAYSTAGHFFVINRRYDEGIRLYRKALELNPRLWEARAQLGVNLMRLGEEHEARQQLEQCYNANYKSAETVNSLRLLDSYKNFVTFKTPTTILRLHKKEAELLRPYFESELKRDIATYEKKYQMKLKGPVQVEVYPDHEDFAVRTMGMPGLGALGVTFGTVVAMDSPSGRPPGSFHWASTMRHELSHVSCCRPPTAASRAGSPKAGGLRGDRRRARLGRPAGSRSHPRHPDKNAAAGGRARSRLHPAQLSVASDRVVFPGRQDLQLHRREVGLLEAARHDPFLRQARIHARRDSKGSGHLHRRISTSSSWRGWMRRPKSPSIISTNGEKS